MATVYPTAAGTWSTRTWNDDATGAAYGLGTPQTGDAVLANNLAITIDTDVDVYSLSNLAGANASAGGGFTTSGIRVVTVSDKCYAGTATCVTITAGSRLQGDCVGGTSANAWGGHASGGLIIGNGTGGSVASAYGINVTAAGTVVGNGYGSPSGSGSGIRNNEGFVFGAGYASTTGLPGAHGIFCIRGYTVVTQAVGDGVAAAYGVSASSTAITCVVESQTGANAVSNSAQSEDYTFVPFADPSRGGGGASFPLIGGGGLVI